MMAFLLSISIALADITGSEEMVRSVSETQVSPGDTFQLCYTTTGTSGKWAIPYYDSIIGGCALANGNTQVKGVMVSDEIDAPGPRCGNVIAPNEEGVCTFVGTYDLSGIEEGKEMGPDITVTIGNPSCTPSWSCGSWSAWSDSVNSCGTKTRTCTDTNNCPGSEDYTDTDTEACSPECVTDDDCEDDEECNDEICEPIDDEDDDDSCEFWETKKGGKCEINMGIIILGGFALVILTRI